MHRIASALLIAAAVLALHGGMLREAFADERGMRQPSRGNSLQAAPVTSAKLLSLLVVLEALRQSPVRMDAPKG